MSIPVKASHYDSIQLLLDFGANPNIKDIHGYSCSDMAIGNTDIQKMFANASLTESKKKKETAQCKSCGTKVGLNRCFSGCFMVWFCSKQCHTEGWPSHKDFCNQV